LAAVGSGPEKKACLIRSRQKKEEHDFRETGLPSKGGGVRGRKKKGNCHSLNQPRDVGSLVLDFRKGWGGVKKGERICLLRKERDKCAGWRRDQSKEQRKNCRDDLQGERMVVQKGGRNRKV